MGLGLDRCHAIFPVAASIANTILSLPTTKTRAAGIAISRDGRRLYVTNRGHDSIATIELDAHTGLPGTVQWTACEGHCPRFLCLGPDGRTLYVANETSHAIVQFALDEIHGVPMATGRRIETGSPVSIAFKTFEE